MSMIWPDRICAGSRDTGLNLPITVKQRPCVTIEQWLFGTALLTGLKKSEHLYSALYGIQTTLKRSGMDHTVLPAINTIPAV